MYGSSDVLYLQGSSISALYVRDRHYLGSALMGGDEQTVVRRNVYSLFLYGDDEDTLIAVLGLIRH